MREMKRRKMRIDWLYCGNLTIFKLCANVNRNHQKAKCTPKPSAARTRRVITMEIIRQARWLCSAVFWSFCERPTFAACLAASARHNQHVMSTAARNKKHSYRRGTARCVVSVEILPTATQQCRNYLLDKSWTNRSYEVRGLQWDNV